MGNRREKTQAPLASAAAEGDASSAASSVGPSPAPAHECEETSDAGTVASWSDIQAASSSHGQLPSMGSAVSALRSPELLCSRINDYGDTGKAMFVPTRDSSTISWSRLLCSSSKFARSDWPGCDVRRGLSHCIGAIV